MVKRRKKAKPASAAQKKARERNWNKGQVINIKATADRIFKSKTTNEQERAILGMIMDSADVILQNWTKIIS